MIPFCWNERKQTWNLIVNVSPSLCCQAEEDLDASSVIILQSKLSLQVAEFIYCLVIAHLHLEFREHKVRYLNSHAPTPNPCIISSPSSFYYVKRKYHLNLVINTDINRKLYLNHKKELVFKCLPPEKLLMAAKIQIWNRIKRRHNLLIRWALRWSHSHYVDT